MMFRNGDDSRTIFVPIILAFIILIAYFTGAFGYLNQIIFAANTLPDFAFGNSTSGIAIVALNLDTSNLQYFTGDKWKDIDSSKDYQFTLNSYVFEPSKVHKALSDFYSSERRPNKLVVEANHWRYWEASLSPSILGFVEIKDALKTGYAPKIDFVQIWMSLSYSNKLISRGPDSVRSFAEHLIPVVSAPLALPVVISWRDQILEGNKCEKFLTIETFQKVGDAYTPIVSLPRTYSVRKIDQYLFVDLDRPVLDTLNEKWKKEDCFKVEQYDDNLIDRSDWLNLAVVTITYDEPHSFRWDSIFGWTMDGVLLNTESIDDDYESDLRQQQSFWLGLIHLFNVETGFSEDDDENIEVTVTDFDGVSRKVHLPKGSIESGAILDKDGSLDENQIRVDRSLYSILQEYNLYFSPSYYFEKSSDGIQKLQNRKDNSFDYTNVYLKDEVLYYDLDLMGSYATGSIENGVFSVLDIPTFNELKLSHPNIDKIKYDSIFEGLNYLNNKKVSSILVKEAKL